MPLRTLPVEPNAMKFCFFYLYCEANHSIYVVFFSPRVARKVIIEMWPVAHDITLTTSLTTQVKRVKSLRTSFFFWLACDASKVKGK